MAMPDHMPQPCRPAGYADKAQGRDAAMARGGLAALLAGVRLAAAVASGLDEHSAGNLMEMLDQHEEPAAAN